MRRADGWRSVGGRYSCVNCGDVLFATRHSHFCGACIRMAVTSAAVVELVRLLFRWLVP